MSNREKLRELIETRVILSNTLLPSSFFTALTANRYARRLTCDSKNVPFPYSLDLASRAVLDLARIALFSAFFLEIGHRPDVLLLTYALTGGLIGLANLGIINDFLSRNPPPKK